VETCKALAYAGARVILCSRSVKAGEQVVKDEIGQPGLGGYTADTSLITVKALDLNSLQSVKAFTDEFNKTESRLDFIVCNAGIMALPSCEYTEAGFERQLGVNHFGHFYLVRLLLPKMLATDDTAGRIVVLSSSAHSMGKIDVNDLHYKNGRSYRAWQAYGQSKLANLLYAKELADRLAESSPNVTAVSVHPGVIQTNLWRFGFCLDSICLFSLFSVFLADKVSSIVWLVDLLKTKVYHKVLPPPFMVVFVLKLELQASEVHIC
jgi:NAD(P)-dependent dehydrogenase (short-subunit alcohol dehydrogenase family)